MNPRNISESIPENLEAEKFEDILRLPGIRIERILSQGHTTPPGEWYDQDENEWVMVLQGTGILTFEDGSTCRLDTGNFVNIPPRCKHRVSWTDPDQTTIWLAVFSKAYPVAQRANKLVELNVMRQCFNVCTSPIVQQAWDAGQPVAVHGLVYDLGDGLLNELTKPITSLVRSLRVVLFPLFFFCITIIIIIEAYPYRPPALFVSVRRMISNTTCSLRR